MYKIWMEELPRDRNWNGTPAAWYGHVPAVGMNFAIYSRVSDEAKATVFDDKYKCARQINEFRSSGYRCRAVPPFEIVTKY